MKYDFQGWATKYNVFCPSDGRTILPGAFKHQNGAKVPLVWGHIHDDPNAVLGHAYLESRDEGMWCYGVFNDTEQGRNAKLLVNHGDLDSVSICANQLKQTKEHGVMHGKIRELSLVLSGANEGARIEPILAHSDNGDAEELIVYNDEFIELNHADGEIPEFPENKDEELEHEEKGATKMAESTEKTVGDVLDSMTEEQRNVTMALVAEKMEEIESLKEQLKHEEDEPEMMHNVFDTESTAQADRAILTHSDLEAVIDLTKKRGSMREAMKEYLSEKVSSLQHDDAEPGEGDVTYGVRDLDIMFPDAKAYGEMPQTIDRDQTWVGKFVNGAKHTPYSRIKCVYADLTADEVRARGYIKGSMKKEQVFRLLKRATTPCTVYTKQKFDRDDLIDIRDWDVLAYTKGVMRTRLDEEIAVASLLGDGRPVESEDKIDETCLRPVITDADLFTIKVRMGNHGVKTVGNRAKDFINAVIWNMQYWKGTGTPSLFTTRAMITECMMLTDEIGRDLYTSLSALANKMGVKEIIPVEVMAQRRPDIYGVLINPNDYTYGTDRGGAVEFFDDFDIDYNQKKYLMETRLSGSLTTPYSAIVFYTANADKPSIPFADRGGYPSDYTGPYDPRNEVSSDDSSESDTDGE